MVGLTILAVAAVAFSRSLANVLPQSIGEYSNEYSHGQYGAGQSCDSVPVGYQCQDNISHYWGQYSPWFSVPSNISAAIPPKCKVTFAQILSRHGARDPTASKTKAYKSLVDKLHANVTSFTGEYAFIANYSYTLGADNLTPFGAQELVNSGIKFYHRYETLAKANDPFIRSSGDQRVVDSATNWTTGFNEARAADRKSRRGPAPGVAVIIPEADGVNNTLNHDLCTAFENGTDSDIASDAQAIWASVFVPPIQARLNENLPGANLSVTETIYFMDLCPFNTVANINGSVSPFCSLFTATEWQQYGYYETLNKFYGYGSGNPLGPTQGVGFAEELLARLTGTPVVPEASINRTLDSDPASFPLNRTLYMDASHDNDMTGILFALGIYNSTEMLSNTTVETTAQTNGYSAAWTVPFAARVYFEKMKCACSEEELVRVVVNDRVQPLTFCGADELGRCTLSDFVSSQTFVRGDGQWSSCFT